jgi:hypothetical protein
MEYFIKSFYELNDIDKLAVEDLKKEIANSKIVPSSSKVAIVTMLFRSYPFYNKNWISVTKETIANSLASGSFSKITWNHEQDQILGSVVKLKTYNDTLPVRVYGWCILDKQALEAKNIKINNLAGYASSVESHFKDWDYFCPALNNKIISRAEAPELESKVNDLINALPVYYHGLRVGLLAGGKNGSINIKGHSILDGQKPADNESSILMVAAKENIIPDLSYFL